MDDGVDAYINAIAPEHWPLFDRMHHLILEVQPEADVRLSYNMPTYVVDAHRLYVGVWKHGLSIYGWDYNRDAGFTARHPELDSGKGTIRLTHQSADHISDDELRNFVRAALEAD